MANVITLDQLYYTPGEPASFSGKNKLYHEALKRGWKGTLKDVDNFLRSQPVHSLHHRSLTKFKRNRFLTFGIDYIWASGIMYTIHQINYTNLLYFLFFRFN